MDKEEKREGLLKRLASKFLKINFYDKEINPQASKEQELPPATQDEIVDNFKHSLVDLITGISGTYRGLEEDRYVRYKDFEEMCLVGDTKIALLNGKSIKIKDWAENFPDKFLFLYSYDIEKNRVVPSVAFNPRLTRENEEIVEVILSNGKTEKTTADHLFLLDNGEYKQASELKKGDKLKSLIRRISEKSRDSLEGYEMIKQNDKWIFTHRLVAEVFLKVSESYKNIKIDVHHKNKNKTDNTPSNLIVLPAYQHIAEHEKEKILEKQQYLFSEEETENIFAVSKKFENLLTETYRNSEEIYVVDVIKSGKREDVYDITVMEFHNFALDSGVFVHNCLDPMIDGALQTYADEATQKDESGQILRISAKDRKVEKMLKELFYDKLKINNLLWRITYDMLKYGDAFYEIVFSKKLDDILYLKYVSPYKIFREEKDGKLIGFKYIKNIQPFLNQKESYVWNYISNNAEESAVIDPYRIVHFRNQDNKYSPYGKSLLDSARMVWKQLQLLEDAVIVYRLVRAPSRRVWYIDTGTLAPSKAFEYVNKIKNMFRKKPIIDPVTGKVTDQTKALSYVEDFWIPVRQGSTGNKIELLEAQQRLGEIDDLQYFREKILFLMRIPLAFFSREGTIELSGKSLAAMDVFFGRAVERVQQFVLEGLYKIAYVYLILKKINLEKIKSIRLELTSPSIYQENARFETLTNKFNLISAIKNTGLLPDVWILKEVLNLSDEEILSILGIMQAQQAGADIISILTGQPNPFLQQQASAGGTEQPTPSGEEELGKEFEKKLGQPPAPEQIAPASPEEIAQSVIPQQPTEKTELSPEDLALKALLNLENLKGNNKKLLIEMLKIIKTKNSVINKKKRNYLNLLESKTKKDKFIYGGFVNFISTGEFKGIEDKIKETIETKPNIIQENNQLKFEQAPENNNNDKKSQIDNHLNIFSKKISFYENVK